jgi:pyruvate dehydrogenase E2 component (dihydrolipoamide acetyltransferase)
MIDFVLPSLGADMDEAMLVAWLVEPGDIVEYGQVIAEVETDKGVIEVECWHDGVMEEVLKEPSTERLPVGTPLARIRLTAEASEAAKESVSTAPAAVAATAAKPRPEPAVHEPTPPVRHLAHTLGVDLEEVRGTGVNGSVTRDDIRRAAIGPGVPTTAPPAPDRPKASPMARKMAAERGIDLSTLPAARLDGLITADQVPVARARRVTEPGDRAAAMRHAIARSMSRSKREIPHYYLSNRIDMRRSLDWLDARNEDLSISDRILPAVLLLKATALAVREVPELNGTWLERGFHPADDVNLGVAVSLREGGLVAPAIHHADLLTVEDLMAKLRDVVGRARTWRLRGSEMSDPTVTVTNLGDRGVDMAFPVIIPPQVAMVGFGKVADAVVVEEGEPAVHPVVHATLAADHRVSDGHRGGLFLSALERLLQEPESL